MVNEMYPNFEKNKQHMSDLLHTEASFDIVSRDVTIGDKNAVFFFGDGFCKDVLMQKLLQFLMGLKSDDLPKNAKELNQLMPYVEVDLTTDFNEITKNILCGVFAIIIDGFDECILIDSRTNPARGIPTGKGQGSARFQGRICGDCRVQHSTHPPTHPKH